MESEIQKEVKGIKIFGIKAEQNHTFISLSLMSF